MRRLLIWLWGPGPYLFQSRPQLCYHCCEKTLADSAIEQNAHVHMSMAGHNDQETLSTILLVCLHFAGKILPPMLYLDDWRWFEVSVQIITGLLLFPSLVSRSTDGRYEGMLLLQGRGKWGGKLLRRSAHCIERLKRPLQ